MEKEKCVLCGDETPYYPTVHIDYRYGYVEGAGQMCSKCYSKGTERSQIAIPADMIYNTPNDADLGAEVRKLYWENHGSYEDLQTYRRGRSKH